MRIRIYSDLHLEFAEFDPPANDADIVILAGDISTKTRGVKWANSAFRCPVIYVSGNHEFYSGHLDGTLRKMKQAASSNVHVLENETFIREETRFLCSTAWTDFSSSGDQIAATKMAWNWMNDFRMIRVDTSYRRLRPDDLVSRNQEAYRWLSAELKKPFSGRTVVVTHHSPIPEVAGHKHDGHLCAAYANSWHQLLDGVDMWVFGHTHQAIDTSLGGCRFVSNPRGYPSEQTGFNPDLTVEFR